MNLHRTSQEPKSNNMRVANIIEEGKLGGPQVRIMLVAHALDGHVDTTVILPEENSLFFRAKCKELDVPYASFHLSRITKEWKVALRYLLFSPVEIYRLVKFIKKMDFDIVHVSGGSWQYKGVIAGRLAGKKVLWHLNDTSMPYLLRKTFSLFSRFSDGYIYASERSKQYYGRLGRHAKCEFIIPAPVDTSAFDPEHSYTGDNELIDNWMDSTVIGTVANINPVKGLEAFIKAASHLNENHDNLVFVVVGPVYPNQQKYFNILNELTEKLSITNIRFVGARMDIRPILKRLDVYVCSSIAESSPISVWEAMSMGKAIVSTDVGDVPLYVKDGYNGFVVDINDHGKISSCVGKIIDDPELHKQMGINSRSIAITSLDLQICANRHFDAYTEIMNP